MSSVPRLWTNEEVRDMQITVYQLRRMRTAAVMTTPTRSLRIWKWLDHAVGGSEKIYSQQEALTHAQELADAAADYFAANISNTKKGTVEKQKWQDLLNDSQRQYALYDTTTYAGTNQLQVVKYDLINRLRNLHIDPEYMLRWDLLENNNLGAPSFSAVLNQSMGIISPLSGDYLVASTYSSYLRRTGRRTFPTRAVALSKDLSEMFLPTNEGKLPFEDQSVIGIYIDVTETGNTARALFRKLQETYPKKRIHKPNTKRVEFTPSKKIDKFWKTPQ